MTSKRVAGHALIDEGAPFGPDGKPLVAFGYIRARSGIGQAKCSCGATSDVLDSGNQRRKWHRTHKAEVLASA